MKRHSLQTRAKRLFEKGEISQEELDEILHSSNHDENQEQEE